MSGSNGGLYLITDGDIKSAGDQPITFPFFIPTIPQASSRQDKPLEPLTKVTNLEQLTQYFEKRGQNQERGMKRALESQMKHQVDGSPGLEVPSLEVAL
ncbi:hypothetical protein HOY82DRAFT_597518 [Tuber indicum]|nr:hypothetical protein HOY82DRAFT_597518 [Tuber indicum]